MTAERYELRGALGAGGAGEVTLAFDRAREHEVALKRLPLADDAGVAVFRRELRALRGLAHPHLTRLLDLGFGRDAAGRFGFYTAARLSATRLDMWARGRPWPELRDAILGPVRALLALHDAGLMHGDVSAANVLVEDDGHATLIDLSCARPIGEALHTLDGTHPAPEILTGAVASAAIDIYALGVMLGQLLGESSPTGARRIVERLTSSHVIERPSDVREVLELLGEPTPERAVASSPLVGRADEMAMFTAHLRTIAAGEPGPRVVSLVGPAGIGRSRLLEEWKWSAQLELQVDEAAGPPPLHLDRLLSRAGADDLPALLARARATPSPLAWFVDDLERSSEASRDRLFRVARALEPTERMTLVVVGAVPANVDARRVELGPLEPRDVESWVGARVSADALARIVGATAGVPADVERVLCRPGVDPERTLRESRDDAGVLETLEPEARRALILIACGGQPPSERVAFRLRREGWTRFEGGAERLLRPGDARRVLGSAREDEIVAAHRELAEHTRGATRVEHLARGGAADEAQALLDARLRAGDSPHALAQAARALAERHPSTSVADVLERAGDASAALGVLARLRRGADPATVDALRLRAGRCRLALGSPAGALRHLRRAQLCVDPTLRLEATEAIAEVHLRRGEHRRALEELLALPEASDRPATEALRGVALSYLGQHDEAREALARAAAGALDPRARLRVVSFRAIDAYRRGSLRDAAQGYREAYAIAQRNRFDEQLPQTALNLATIEHRLGDLGAALRRYDEALAWARAFDRKSTEVTLRVNHARLHAELGAFARARTGLQQGRAMAEEHGLSFFIAESHALEAEIAWMTGADGRAAAATAIDGFESIGATRELADTWLITALLRAEASDLTGAADALKRAGTSHSDDLEARALEARARLEQLEGRTSEALGTLDEARRIAEAIDEPGLLARLLARSAELSRALDAPHAAGDFEGRALAIWDRAAATLPAGLREGFWTHPHRTSVQKAPAATTEASAPTPPSTVQRLLRLAARVAEARDPDAVLELAMDSAVELTGAERGFVLLVGPDGLRVAVARNFDREDLARASDKFSRTIAERVIDTAAPVLTAEAQRDARFSSGTSVHAMQLRSVLSVPIQTRAAVLGALYVDNRFQRGRFEPSHVELLTGFADQVAIALTNARLHRELEQRTQELTDERERIAGLLADKTAEVERLSGALQGRGGFHGLVGRSPAMRELIGAIRRLADAPVTVLVEGESGCGKELVARAIHRSGSRRDAPFVSVNCGAIPEALLESELFGHVRGAFTGATRDARGLFLEAGEGTLFLDEVGEMPMGMQVKLLRALQQREVRPVGASSPEPFRARVLAATNRTLRDEVAAGRFREDLYYRLAVVELRVPALRERREDIPELARALLARIADEGGARAKLTAGAVRALSEHDWPGNVRQLENALHAAAVFAEAGRIVADAIVLPAARPPEAVSERDRIERALHRHAWNVSKVGRSLGIPRMTLYRRLQKYGLDRPKSLGKRETGKA